MKTIKINVMLMLFALVLTSCSSEDDTLILQQQATKSLLKSYEIGKNTDGSYFVDYTTENASSNTSSDAMGTYNEITLLQDNSVSEKNITHDLGFVGKQGKLNVKFNDTQREKVTFITVVDDNIQFSKKDNELLADFNFKANEDGSFDLDFKVLDNVQVNFVYNDELESYDIHLTEGKSSESEFLRTFTPDQDGNLRIAFVTSNEVGRGVTDRRPEVIVGNGGSGTIGG